MNEPNELSPGRKRWIYYFLWGQRDQLQPWGVIPWLRADTRQFAGIVWLPVEAAVFEPGYDDWFE